MNRDRVEGLVLLTFAVACWWGARLIKLHGISDPAGPSAFPKLLAFVLGATGAALLMSPSPPKVEEKGRPIRIVAVFGMLIFYALVFERVGFLVSTILFLSGSIAIFAPNWRWRIPLFAVLLTMTLGLVFWALGVPLP